MRSRQYPTFLTRKSAKRCAVDPVDNPTGSFPLPPRARRIEEKMDLNPDIHDAALESVTDDATEGHVALDGNGHARNGKRHLTLAPTHESENGNGNGNGHNGNGNGHGPVALDSARFVPADVDERTGEIQPIARTPVSVVIPAKNEARNIAWVLRLLPEWVDEVILVDGNSTDDTIDVARAVRPDIVIVNDDRPGKGAALRAGFAAASCELVVMIDADGSMDPGEIDRYVELLDEGYDLVKGSRFMEGGGSADISHVRSLGNRVLRGLVNVLYGQRFTELCYGLMAFRTSRLPDMALRSDGFEIETEIVVRAIKADLRIAEVPSFELPRRYGDSNLNAFRDGRRVLRTLLTERIGWRRRRSVAARREVELAELPATAAFETTAS